MWKTRFSDAARDLSVHKSDIVRGQTRLLFLTFRSWRSVRANHLFFYSGFNRVLCFLVKHIIALVCHVHFMVAPEFFTLIFSGTNFFLHHTILSIHLDQYVMGRKRLAAKLQSVFHSLCSPEPDLRDVFLGWRQTIRRQKLERDRLVLTAEARVLYDQVRLGGAIVRLRIFLCSFACMLLLL
jgi:hypothetical protein